MTRLLLSLALGLTVVAFDPGPAAADGRRGWHGRHSVAHHNFRHHHRSHFAHHGGLHRWRPGRLHFGFGHGRHGSWWGLGTSWYLYPPPVYAYPPEVVYVPRPVPQAAAAPPPRPYCREYRGDAIIDGTNQRFYGTACLQPNGSWRIVN